MRTSVIVANYNYCYYISKTLTSLISQSIPPQDYEIIVIDDGSNDISLKILEPYLDTIRVFTGTHQGQTEACNEGFQKAKGQYLVRVDADDYVNRNFLEIESLFLEENKDFDAVSCDYYKVDNKGNRLSRHTSSIEPIACGVMFRREALFDVGLYEKGVWTDTDYVSKFAREKHLYNIPLPLYRYLQHGDSLTHKEAV
jgi:glycosyltransferase involved in cell wall biosynthesis